MQANAGADDAAANRGAPATRNVDRDRDADAGHGRSREQGERRQPDIVGNADSRVVGEHCDEMRRPDPAPGRQAGRDDPDRARSPGGLLRTMKEIHRDKAGKETDDAGDDDEPPVMLGREAGEDAEHVGKIRSLG